MASSSSSIGAAGARGIRYPYVENRTVSLEFPEGAQEIVIEIFDDRKCVCEIVVPANHSKAYIPEKYFRGNFGFRATCYFGEESKSVCDWVEKLTALNFLS